MSSTFLRLRLQSSFLPLGLITATIPPALVIFFGEMNETERGVGGGEGGSIVVQQTRGLTKFGDEFIIGGVS